MCIYIYKGWNIFSVANTLFCTYVYKTSQVSQLQQDKCVIMLIHSDSSGSYHAPQQQYIFMISYSFRTSRLAVNRLSILISVGL